MTDVIIVVNSGSSSLKFAVYPMAGTGETPLIAGKVAGIGRKPELTARDETGSIDPTGALTDIPHDADHAWIIGQLLDRLETRFSTLHPVAAGHRVVHGGREFAGPVIVTDDMRTRLGQLSSLAPLHQPHNLAAIDAIRKIAPDLPQVACFDTSFHRTQPRIAQLFALPRHLSDEGIIRYGFHGVSYDYIAGVLPEHLGEAADGRVIVAHLGNGASMCAMQGRKSIATSMGFTALDGLMMGRRCGSLDAGVVLDLLQNRGMSVAEVEDLLYRQSGLFGVSGITNNMQELEQSDDPHAREAVELFCYRAASEIGSLTAALGGLDALVFTAGIGENSSIVRHLICERCAWLGVELDQTRNEAGKSTISTSRSEIAVCVIPTNEEAVIAASTRDLIGDDGD